MVVAESKFGAVAPFLGYLYQCRQALLLSIQLSKSFPSLTISIEKFDDVAIESAGVPAVQLQLKHHITPGALTDKSPDIWKTLRVWSEQTLDNPQLPFETRFVLFTTGCAGEGTAAAALRLGRTRQDEERALALLEEAAKSSKSQETKAAREAFMDLSPAARRSLIASFLVFDKAPNITNVRAEIEDMLAFAVPAQHIDALVDNLEGWWGAAVIRSLTDDSEPPLSLLALRAKVDELASAFRRGDLLLNPELGAALTGVELTSDNRTFVRQMRCIGLGQSPIDMAKRDYYKATTQRSEWVRENALFDGEAQRYDDSLVDRWQRECMALAEETNLSSEDIKKSYGRQIFHWANRYQAPFRNRHEAWLTTGSFHLLADNIRVGWHPDFQRLFSSSECV
ncbi:hypothetical protein XI06_39185 [Bradyrhizobium sp. CCBAU 11434]|uniref:ABC-three component system protein n=1 Tax=Bradyrhizobium sp. CCBAU 11434 TaxID=1630885 RepID=UPI00230556B2|nr:ABC-three component system protein [Bradyrhizobium sp. CCBAU 11434]MDA9526206.1 hypothetical protein [Bradyrhizobium sp. CCBAU 11434]